MPVHSDSLPRTCTCIWGVIDGLKCLVGHSKIKQQRCCVWLASVHDCIFLRGSLFSAYGPGCVENGDSGVNGLKWLIGLSKQGGWRPGKQRLKTKDPENEDPQAYQTANNISTSFMLFETINNLSLVNYGRVFVFHTSRRVYGKRRPKTKTPTKNTITNGG